MAKLEDLEALQDKMFDTAGDIEQELLPLTNNAPVTIGAPARVENIASALRTLGRALDAPIGQALREKRARAQ